MLNNLTEKSEKDEIAFEFLPNMCYPQIDVIKRGESIYHEQELSKKNASKLLNETFQNIKITLKENCFHFLDSFCKIETNFPQEISKKWNELTSKTKNSNNNSSFFPNSSFKFEKPHTLTLEEKISNRFEEKSMKNTSFQKKNADLNANFLNDHDDENDLLSSELINFTLTEIQDPLLNQPILSHPHNKNSSDNSIVYSNNSHNNNFSNNSHMNTSSNNGQNASGFGNLTPIRSLNEISLPGNIQKVLTESIVNNNNQPQQKINNNEKQIRGNTPNTERKLFLNEGNSGTNGSKLYKKKTKFIIGEKFESVLEGLKKDSLDTVDFTGAGFFYFSLNCFFYFSLIVFFYFLVIFFLLGNVYNFFFLMKFFNFIQSFFHLKIFLKISI